MADTNGKWDGSELPYLPADDYRVDRLRRDPHRRVRGARPDHLRGDPPRAVERQRGAQPGDHHHLALTDRGDRSRPELRDPDRRGGVRLLRTLPPASERRGGLGDQVDLRVPGADDGDPRRRRLPQQRPVDRDQSPAGRLHVQPRHDRRQGLLLGHELATPLRPRRDDAGVLLPRRDQRLRRAESVSADQDRGCGRGASRRRAHVRAPLADAAHGGARPALAALGHKRRPLARPRHDRGLRRADGKGRHAEDHR